MNVKVVSTKVTLLMEFEIPAQRPLTTDELYRLSDNVKTHARENRLSLITRKNLEITVLASNHFKRVRPEDLEPYKGGKQ